MNDEDIKKLRVLIKEEVRTIKDIVEVTKKKVDSQELHVHVTAENVRRIKEQQSIINEKLDDIKDVQEQHTESLVTIESKIGIYEDMYKLNNDNMKKLEKRQGFLEEKSGVIPDPEHTLVNLTS